jgi:hypothetical protein
MMAGSHGLAEAATTSAAWIKSASQTMLGSVLGKAGPPVMIASRCLILRAMGALVRFQVTSSGRQNGFVEPAGSPPAGFRF